jgi:hypothetical protein
MDRVTESRVLSPSVQLTVDPAVSGFTTAIFYNIAIRPAD